MGRSASVCLGVAAFAAISIYSADLGAADMRAGAVAVAAGQQLALDCDNGRTYPIRVRAVSDAGELVTGYLYTAPRRAQHFRLVPMGNGYRYAGHGFWFDGVRGEAMLDIGRSAASCTVVYGS